VNSQTIYAQRSNSGVLALIYRSNSNEVEEAAIRPIIPKSDKLAN